MKKIPCPRCKRLLPQSGVVTIGVVEYPVYQCDDCLVPTDFGGETIEVNYTFALDAEGKAFDPGGDVNIN